MNNPKHKMNCGFNLIYLIVWEILVNFRLFVCFFFPCYKTRRSLLRLPFWACPWDYVRVAYPGGEAPLRELERRIWPDDFWKKSSLGDRIQDQSRVFAIRVVQWLGWGFGTWIQERETNYFGRCSWRWSFLFCFGCAATQAARQVQQERAQVVCSHGNKVARKRLARRHSRNGP